MADVQPLRALHYDLGSVGALADVVAPPYDVIDADQRAHLAARSPHNVVAIDLPEDSGGDPYAAAAKLVARWRDEGSLVRDERPALWVLSQDYTAPDGSRRDRRRADGAARCRVADRRWPSPL